MFAGFSRLTLLLAASMLLLAGAFLGMRPAPSFTERDAWAASLERGERHLPPQRMAREWRDEIAAQQRLLSRDRWLGGAMAGVGLVALVAFGATTRATRRSTALA